MKYIIIYAEGFSDKIMIVTEPGKPDNQDRGAFFNEFYINVKENAYLTLLDDKNLDLLKNRTLNYLTKDYRELVTKYVTEKHHKIRKNFLNEEFELFIIADRLAILGIDLYNINIYSKENNIPIKYKTANTAKESSRLKFV